MILTACGRSVSVTAHFCDSPTEGGGLNPISLTRKAKAGEKPPGSGHKQVPEMGSGSDLSSVEWRASVNLGSSGFLCTPNVNGLYFNGGFYLGLSLALALFSSFSFSPVPFLHLSPPFPSFSPSSSMLPIPPPSSLFPTRPPPCLLASSSPPFSLLPSPLTSSSLWIYTL